MRRAVSIGAALLALLAVQQALAITIHVPGDQPSIQAGVSAASDGDTVLVTCGTYQEHDIVMKSGVCVASASGDPSCVIIDADHQGRVLYCESAGNATRLEGLTFANGLVIGNPPDGEGAGVYCVSASPTLARCVFDGNRAQHSPGSRWRDAASGSGMSCINGSSPTLVDCVFRGNSAEGCGAGVFCGYGDSSPVLERCRFENNQSGGSAGAFWCWGGAPTLSSCLFLNNAAASADGGAVLLESGCDATLTDCTFQGNEAYDFGGAILLGVGSAPIIERCLFDANTAGHSGGAFASMAQDHAPSTPEFTDCTFVANTAAVFGGALYAEHSTAALSNCLIAFCGPRLGPVYCGPVATSISLLCCDLYGNAGGDWVGCIADQYALNGNISEDPLFCGPSNGDFTVAENSPCAPSNNTCGVLIGACGIGCGPSVIEPTSWGKIKAQYLANPMQPPN